MDTLGKAPPSSEITPGPLYLRRREFIRNALLFTATSTGVGGSLLWLMKGSRASEPTLYAIILGALLLVRLIVYLRSRLAMPSTT